MNKMTIGVDPDSSKNGVAIYKGVELFDLLNLTTIQFYLLCEEFHEHISAVNIENVNGNRCSSFGWRSLPNAKVKAKYSESVGKCKHAQQEIERICEYFDIKIVHHKVSSKWKDAQGKKEFERVTGWTKRSNEDTRSAAWFGCVGSRHK